MNWEQLTAPDFTKAVKETGGVCVFPMGVLEKHSDHLPVGTDYLIVHKIASLAAEKEPAVVFPPFYFGQVNCARCFPGAVTLKPAMTVELIQGILDEIGRNGFKKIIICNGHGGNMELVTFLARCSLWEEKPYWVYVTNWFERGNEESEKRWDSIFESSVHGHACECETSLSLAIHEYMVKMDMVPNEPGLPLKRLEGIPFSGLSWYGDHPDHYRGDARSATAEKGHKALEIAVDHLTGVIASVKADKVAPALAMEFFQRVEELKNA